jgi:iron only hydrogenase large subunit-like protein
MAHRIRPGRLALTAVACAAISGCVQSPASAARQAQEFNDIGDQLNDLRTENATLESVVDSLRTVIAKHDTTMARLANATGVVVVK